MAGSVLMSEEMCSSLASTRMHRETISRTTAGTAGRVVQPLTFSRALCMEVSFRSAGGAPGVDTTTGDNRTGGPDGDQTRRADAQGDPIPVCDTVHRHKPGMPPAGASPPPNISICKWGDQL